jgi:hypothetical protein
MCNSIVQIENILFIYNKNHKNRVSSKKWKNHLMEILLRTEMR